MQHDYLEPLPEDDVLPAPLDHSAVLLSLWPSLSTKDRRALRRCCAGMCAAVDAHAGSVKGRAEAPALSSTTCDRLVSTHTLTLRSMACLRGMLVDAPGAFFPRLQSLRLHLVRARMATTPCAPCVHRGRVDRAMQARHACGGASSDALQTHHAMHARTQLPMRRCLIRDECPAVIISARGRMHIMNYACAGWDARLAPSFCCHRL
jgi:hypothetical protein